MFSFSKLPFRARSAARDLILSKGSAHGFFREIFVRIDPRIWFWGWLYFHFLGHHGLCLWGASKIIENLLPNRRSLQNGLRKALRVHGICLHFIKKVGRRFTKIHVLIIGQILLLSSLIGCGKPIETFQIEFDPALYTYAPSTLANGKRVFLIHGMWGSHEMFEIGPYKTLKDALLSQGYEVVSFDCPTFTASLFRDNGSYYKSQLISRLNLAIEQANQAFGHTAKNILGGISFGGMHALVAMAEMPQFEAYFALIPLLQVSKLGYFPNVNNDGFKPEASSLLNRPGYIAWSSDDLVVDYTQAEQFHMELVNLGADITHEVYANQGHSISNDPSTLISWLNAL